MTESDEMKTIMDEVAACRRCVLHGARKRTVPGEGGDHARIMLIGEAPGYNEDVQGRPFVGRAGAFLDELLSSVGLKRNDVFITNILKCRPPGNRNPKSEEIKSCTPYLDRQIALLAPATICPMGNFAAGYILEKFGIKPAPIGSIHGKTFRIKSLIMDARIIPLYHPASAIYNPNMRNTLLEDFKNVAE
ncbi:MAG: uracil-DNA glycosylase [Candidatus Aenigmarchaeota archaeon]|nr:uracil-DNA glycosylase [Candidatus Aenigmarchaeota archaeon]